MGVENNWTVNLYTHRHQHTEDAGIFVCSINKGANQILEEYSHLHVLSLGIPQWHRHKTFHIKTFQFSSPLFPFHHSLVGSNLLRSVPKVLVCLLLSSTCQMLPHLSRQILSRLKMEPGELGGICKHGRHVAYSWHSHRKPKNRSDIKEKGWSFKYDSTPAQRASDQTKPVGVLI